MAEASKSLEPQTRTSISRTCGRLVPNRFTVSIRHFGRHSGTDTHPLTSGWMVIGKMKSCSSLMIWRVDVL